MVAVDPSTATSRAVLVIRMVKSHLSIGLKPYWKPESNDIELNADFTLTPIISIISLTPIINFEARFSTGSDWLSLLRQVLIRLLSLCYAQAIFETKPLEFGLMIAPCHQSRNKASGFAFFTGHHRLPRCDVQFWTTLEVRFLLHSNQPRGNCFIR